MPWRSKILPGKGDGNALHYSCLGNSMDRGGWWATDHEVTGVRHDWATEYAHRHWTLLIRFQLYTSFLPPRCDNHNVYRYCQMPPWEKNQQAEWKTPQTPISELEVQKSQNDRLYLYFICWQGLGKFPQNTYSFRIQSWHFWCQTSKIF